MLTEEFKIFIVYADASTNYLLFFMPESLRALYMGDNDFEYISPEIKNLKNLQIVSFNVPTIFLDIFGF